MVKYDSKGRLVQIECENFTQEMDEQLLVLDSAIKFCTIHKGLKLQDVSDRLKYLKQRQPNKTYKHYTPEDEKKLLDLHKIYGTNYRLYVKHFPGRTAVNIKQKMYCLLSKKEALV